MKALTKSEILESIKKRSIVDEIDSFMLGLQAPVEREIMRYIYYNNNFADYHMLINRFVYQVGVCSKLTLKRRLDSLVKYNFLSQGRYRDIVYYEVVKENEEKSDDE